MDTITSKPEKRNISELRIHKIKTIQLAKTVEATNLEDKERFALDLRTCGGRIVTANERIIAATFCKRRLCPMCAWRRSMRIYANIHAITTAPEFSNLQFTFLTLTVKNCKGERLPETLDLITSGWRRLTSNKRQPIRQSFLGTFRAVEVTYDGDRIISKDRYYKKDKLGRCVYKAYYDRLGLKPGDDNPNYDMYHPHLHVLAAADESYFAPNGPKYITHGRLIELWRGATGAEYDPSVYIEAVKDNEMHKAVSETAKYAVKVTDLIDRPRAVETLEPALKGLRLIAYGDLFKTVKARLRLDDELLEDVRKEEADEIFRNRLIQKMLRTWNFGAKLYDVRVLEHGECIPGRRSLRHKTGGD
jgi:plasmid rolling circle replication initiator protein Rep